LTDPLIFSKIRNGEAIPFDLLLLADPSRASIDEYLEDSDVFVVKRHNNIQGIIVVNPLNEEEVEIKNVAVKTECQGRGIGSMLINYAVRIAAENHKKVIYIGTANSSIEQLRLYQKLGFEIFAVRENFFTTNYPEPIYENGIQALHMFMLKKELHT